MATVALTVQSVPANVGAGLTPTFVAPGGAGAGNGWTFANTGSEYVRMKNTSGAPVVATVLAPNTDGGVAYTAPTVNVPATTGDVTLGKLDPRIFGTTVTIEVASASGMTAAAFK